MHINPGTDQKQGRYGIGGGYNKKIIGFVIHNIDTTDKPNWTSPLITDYEKDDTDYLVRVEMPVSIIGNTKRAWGEAYVKKYWRDTAVLKYGGVVLSNIKLFLKSTPEGAETFLIPNRIWTNKIENSNWEKNNSILENYRVNTAITNTFAYVDETVFVVLYRYKNVFKKIIYHTKPMSVEKEQVAWVQF